VNVVEENEAKAEKTLLSLHWVGVVCGLAAAAWLGTAEAPVKLAAADVPPFIVTLGMVLGVFLARWTLPVMLKGAGFVLNDLRTHAHLMVWALLAGALWVVANTLTVFAIKNVGLSIAFPLWNMNSLVGLLWGWLLFGELRGAGARCWSRVAGGALALVAGATVLAWATTNHAAGAAGHPGLGVMAALGAGALWGTQYICYRKAYLSGINPLSFVTVIAFSELVSTLVLGAAFAGGLGSLGHQVVAAKPYMFWLFLGGICWVFGDLFQQYAAKYVGIGRGMPLANTNQLWGLAWGALVFGELTALDARARLLVLAGSFVMIVGVVLIGTASAPASEQDSWQRAVDRECDRYGLDRARVASVVHGDNAEARQGSRRRWWEALIPLSALAVLGWLASFAERPQAAIHLGWTVVLLVATLGFLLVSGSLLWKRTRFS
jgi:drug/metabolite transporter (DMT)-like permease